MNSRWLLRARALAVAVGVALVAVVPLDPGSASAAADLRRIETVGAVGVREGDRRDPRAAAVQHALREAVFRVASDFLVDAVWPTDVEDPDDPDSQTAATADSDLVKILGTDMGPYTARFKVIEDRGRGPALFVEDRAVTEEYVVVAEVVVEADRVRERLVSSGLLEDLGAAATTPIVRLIVQGLTVYPAYADVRELITGPVGAQSAIALEFERGSATLAVATSMTGKQLVAAIQREAPPHLTIIPLGSTGSDPRIAVRWSLRQQDAELPPVESGNPDWWKPGGSKRRRR